MAYSSGPEQREDSSRHELLLRKISDIEPIEKNRAIKIEKAEDLDELVEGPLLSACKELWNKNIMTEGASANRKDTAAENPVASIVINYDTLSEENKEVATSVGKLYHADEHNLVRIEIPINQHSTWAEVQEEANRITHRFTKQRFRPYTQTLEEAKSAATFDPNATIEEIRTALGIDPADASFNEQSLSNWYWVPEKQLFYPNKGQYEKSLEEVDERK